MKRYTSMIVWDLEIAMHMPNLGRHSDPSQVNGPNYTRHSPAPNKMARDKRGPFSLPRLRIYVKLFYAALYLSVGPLFLLVGLMLAQTQVLQCLPKTSS